MTQPRRLDEHLVDTFVGRAEELAALSACLESSGPAVTFVHGLSGVGISALLERSEVTARQQGIVVVHLDCHAVQPTPDAVLDALDPSATPSSDPDPEPQLQRAQRVATSLGAPGRTLVVFDHWHAFRLVDAWFRREFVPLLPDSVSVVLGGHEPPVAAWRASTAPAALVRELPVGVLDRVDSLDLLEREGITGDVAERLYALTHGLPLALRVAAAAVRRHPGGSSRDLTAVALPQVAAAMSEAYLATLGRRMRAAVDVLSVVRRATAGLLAALVPVEDADLASEVARLPFVRADADGLTLHDAVRGPLAASFRALDPARYAAYRQVAWRALDEELRSVPPVDSWRFTADLLYLIDHPLVRDAFFPPTGPHPTVEAADRADVDRIVSIAVASLPGPTADAVTAVATAVPERIRVARGEEVVTGIQLVVERSSLTSDHLRREPSVVAIREHLRRSPIAPDDDLLVVLASLSAAGGEGHDDVTAALWLDLKRTYLERRGRLRRVYAVVTDGPSFLAAAGPLGFVALGPPLSVGGVSRQVMMLELGPAGVDGWLTRLAAEQVGTTPDPIELDAGTRTVHLVGREVSLSRLEFGMLEHLVRRAGRPASRSELIRDVWGHDYDGGSNVVDAVVRTLRRKLGASAGVVEAVRGVGYRYVRPRSQIETDVHRTPAGAARPT